RVVAQRRWALRAGPVDHLPGQSIGAGLGGLSTALLARIEKAHAPLLGGDVPHRDAARLSFLLPVLEQLTTALDDQVGQLRLDTEPARDAPPQPVCGAEVV